ERQAIERPIARRHVRRCIERGCAGKQPWKPREEEQRLLSAHAAAECVDPMTIDVQPGDGVLRDLRHPGEVTDLSWITPREESQLPALALWVDDGEAAARRQV